MYRENQIKFKIGIAGLSVQKDLFGPRKPLLNLEVLVITIYKKRKTSKIIVLLANHFSLDNVHSQFILLQYR